MADTLAGGYRAEQRFAAPNGAVRAISRAVPDESGGGKPNIVLGQHRGKVRVMMLHGIDRKSERPRKARCGIVGMQIAGDRFRRDVK
ncbi:hypothetical protein SDC9_185430 [bioreactor metagenome]|uniref:Uncharacterized protein n=1 Tax=bioreactor metagenome TaxID=1076179 RepID=A0A645HI90_9ZZZZ